ncbi:fibronectin type III domain-containing protein [Cohnella abietis]|uniref:Uncharacterized protein n=1 Tax=Cohnella abietis TaxID=2507935 RepID=A0A3T1CYG8_9BACL|nr:fibronectin type III domain-containing protein [Cohnella abietis]BBI30819.1 hypothetical protein KCTCHS21_02180 [Cohnella abietis]
MKKTKWLSYVLTAALGLNLFAVVAPPVSAADVVQTELDISKGDIVIDKDAVTVNKVAVAYNPNGYVIKGKASTTSATITIKGGVEHNITLDTLTNDRTTTNSNASGSALVLAGTGTKVNLLLKATSSLSTSSNGKAGINVPPGTELVINTVDGNDTPKLIVKSAGTAAAIGGNDNESAGKITINHGTIDASFSSGGATAAVIGGGKGGQGGTIVINGGVITATQDINNNTGAAIGGGNVNSPYPDWVDKLKPDTSVTINGGTIITKVKNNPSFDSIGMGYANTKLEENTARTKVVVNGGNIYTTNASSNGVSLLYNRVPVNSDGVSVYATSIKVDPALTSGAAVTVKYADTTLDTTLQGSSGSVYLFLPVGTIPVEITNKSNGKTHFGKVKTTTATAATPGISSYPFSAGTVSRLIGSTAPKVSVLSNADNGISSGRFFYGANVTLSVTNLDDIVNKSDYPLVFGTDFTVEWYRGTGNNPARIDTNNPAQVTVNLGQGEVIRAKLVAIDPLVSPATKLDASSTNFSDSLIADWQRRTLGFQDLKSGYPFGASGTVIAKASAGSDAITYASSDSSILSVDASTGAWTAHKLGSATITASISENATDKLSAAAVSQVVEVTPIIPLAPVQVSAVPGDQQAEVSFVVTPNKDGSANTGYTVTAWNDENVAGTGTGTKSPIIVTGLTNGKSYTFTVVAKNAVGNSLVSTASAAVTPVGVPNAPTGVTATAGKGQATVEFIASLDNGSEITLYTVTAWDDVTAVGTGTGVASPITITGLTNGKSYTFTVVAKNAVGSSLVSTASAAVTPVGVPNAPTGVTATAGNGQATVEFTAPSDNGSEITLYTVTAWNNGTQAGTGTGAASPITVTGLTNGKSYTFKVVATNAVGNSLGSEASAAVTPIVTETPAAIPNAPTGVTAKAGNGQATVEFTVPSNNGSAITHYTVTAWNNGAKAATKTGTTNQITVSGLTNGTSYTFKVVATNAVGDSLESAASEAVTPTDVTETPATVPNAPTGVTATAGNGQATVKFTVPLDNGSAITHYTVTAWNNGAKAATKTGTTNQITVTGLANGTSYTFNVVATNAVGDSLESAASEAVTPTDVTETPAAVPNAPTGVTATAGNGQATVSFTVPSDNGSEITHYTVTAWNNGAKTATKTGTTSQITVTELTNGTSYTFTVVATNAVGASTQSAASNVVTPTGDTGVFIPSPPIVDDKGKNDNQSVRNETDIPSNQSGSLQLNQEVWVTVPSGTADKPLKIKVEKLTGATDLVADKETLASPIYELTKNFAENFSQNITLKFAFDTSVLKDDAHTVSVFYYDETARRWVEIGGGIVNNGFITINVNHFTKFAVFVVAKNTEPVEPGVPQFTDLEGHWAVNAIKQAVAKGFVNGYANGQFKPNGHITRAEFIAILVRVLNLQTEGAQLSLTDTDKISKWAVKPIAQAVEAKLITGYSDGSFRPNEQITRAEIVTIIARAFNLKIKEGVASSGFADDRLIPAWAKGAAEAAREKGIVSGRSGNQFAPNDPATRAEVIVILLNALGSK